MKKNDETRERLMNFAVSVMKLADKLPKTAAGKQMAEKVVQRGPTAAVRYARAGAAFSPRDFLEELWGVYGGLIDANGALEELVQQKLIGQQTIAAIQQEYNDLLQLVEVKIHLAMDDLGKPKTRRTYEPPI